MTYMSVYGSLLDCQDVSLLATWIPNHITHMDTESHDIYGWVCDVAHLDSLSHITHMHAELTHTHAFRNTYTHSETHHTYAFRIT